MEWKTSNSLIDYINAVQIMESRIAKIRTREASELIWLLEHPPLYSAGTSAKPEDLIDSHKLPVFKSGRGGQYTYHGPGQRVAYLMLNLAARSKNGEADLHSFIRSLENWLIMTLKSFGVTGQRKVGNVGIWVKNSSGQDFKIASIGIRVRHWVTFHGVSINVDPDLTNFKGIVPCGVQNSEVTSLSALGLNTSMEEFDKALKREFLVEFGE